MAKNKIQLNSHNFENVYKWLGINLDKLGCIMLDLKPLNLVPYPLFKIKDFYFAKNKSRFWINGWLAATDTPHVTLLYGLLESGNDYSMHIKEVLADWKLKNVEVEDVGFFNSPYSDEPYYCIVAHIKVTPQLMEGHQRLEFLPHINTFAGYKPHITLAYIRKDDKLRKKVITYFKNNLIGKRLKISEPINLGKK